MCVWACGGVWVYGWVRVCACKCVSESLTIRGWWVNVFMWVGEHACVRMHVRGLCDACMSLSVHAVRVTVYGHVNQCE